MMWYASECAVSLYIREVFKARNRKTNHMVALKKVRMENEKEGVSSPHSPLERLVTAITAPPSYLLPPHYPSPLPPPSSLLTVPPSSVPNDGSERDSHSTTSQT